MYLPLQYIYKINRWLSFLYFSVYPSIYLSHTIIIFLLCVYNIELPLSASHFLLLSSSKYFFVPFLKDCSYCGRGKWYTPFNMTTLNAFCLALIIIIIRDRQVFWGIIAYLGKTITDNIYTSTNNIHIYNLINISAISHRNSPS